MPSAFLHFALIHLLMAMRPGPNTVAVSYFTAARSRSAGFRAAAGVAAASFIWLIPRVSDYDPYDRSDFESRLAPGFMLLFGLKILDAARRI
ncbi:hypothetical protein FJU08_00045 [Martelella alba]|uniref:Uncharacterized protein n=1 Tax=Martelella alba TaxID=2590451 RepID=A0A506UI53_9HYPH|nr:hypothetical protein [Martelella alba]TPW32997.1 hypothetical protein FJU08_00045 [Martelella alba]